MKHTTYRRMAYAMAAAIMGSLAIAGCEREDDVQTLKMVAESHQGAGKTSVDGNAVYWVDGDKVLINGTEYPVSYNGTDAATVEPVATADADLLAIYPSGISTEGSAAATSVTVNLPSSYIYETDGERQAVAFPMVAKNNVQDGFLSFKHICGAVQLTLKNTTGYPLVVRSITVSSNSSQLCGSRSLDVSDFDNFAVAPATTSTAAEKSVTLALPEEDVILANNGEKSFQIPVYPIASGDQLKFTVYSGEKRLEGVVVTALYIYERDGITTTKAIGRAEVASTPTIAINSASSYVQTVDSKFTVGSTTPGSGTQVYFSQGILQYVTSSSSWRFAENQYTAEGPAANTAASPAVRDLFYYGETSPGSAYTQINGKVSGEANDWARESTITNGGSEPMKWRTLTYDEWENLLYRETGHTIAGKANASFAMVKINGINGILLFPDAFDPSTLSTLSVNWIADAINTENHVIDSLNGQKVTDQEPNAGTNTYKLSASVSPIEVSLTDWAVLEAAGCVFIVENGAIDANGNVAYQRTAIYWLGTQRSDNNGHLIFANNLGVATKKGRPHKSGLYDKNKQNKCAVRMVRDVE